MGRTPEGHKEIGSGRGTAHDKRPDRKLAPLKQRLVRRIYKALPKAYPLVVVEALLAKGGYF
jgi:hypothetical protein